MLLPAPTDTTDHINEIDTSSADNVSKDDVDVNPDESAEEAPIIYVVYSIW